MVHEDELASLALVVRNLLNRIEALEAKQCEGFFDDVATPDDGDNLPSDRSVLSTLIRAYMPQK